MNLIKLNELVTPPPSSYDVEYSDVNGEKTQLEDGTTYIERVRSDVSTIKVAWKNLTTEQAAAITNEVSNDIVSVTYFYGTEKQADMTASARSLKLKHIENSEVAYWDVSFTLEG